MVAYLTIIEIALLALVIYESYKYFIFKYRSSLVNAVIKEIKEYEVFQRPSNKVLEGEKRALKVTLEYEVNKKNIGKQKE